jgi:hypothetical protein
LGGGDELLDALIPGVGHIEIALAINRDPPRIVKPPRLPTVFVPDG